MQHSDAAADSASEAQFGHQVSDKIIKFLIIDKCKIIHIFIAPIASILLLLLSLVF